MEFIGQGVSLSRVWIERGTIKLFYYIVGANYDDFTLFEKQLH